MSQSEILALGSPSMSERCSTAAAEWMSSAVLFMDAIKWVREQTTILQEYLDADANNLSTDLQEWSTAPENKKWLDARTMQEWIKTGQIQNLMQSANI